MTSKQLRQVLSDRGISTALLADIVGVTNKHIAYEIRFYDRLKPEYKARLDKAIRTIIGDEGQKIPPVDVYWRFAERDANADKRRGLPPGQRIEPCWIPTTLYPIIQFGGETMLPKPPPDLRWSLREVLGNDETATQAFDRLIDTDSKPIKWREAEPVGAVV